MRGDESGPGEGVPGVFEAQYLELLRELLERGEPKGDRTGTGTLSLFGRVLRCPLDQAPALTVRRMWAAGAAVEGAWYASGSSNVRDLHALNPERPVRVWDPWADKDGRLGEVYGRNWRLWSSPYSGGRGRLCIDQLQYLIREPLRSDPDSRRMVLMNWHPGALLAGEQRLPPCAYAWQVVATAGKLNMLVHLRSSDVAVGLPWNALTYAVVAHMLAREAELEMGDLVLTLGDAHLYRNQEEHAREMLARRPRLAPRLEIDPAVKRLEDLRAKHVLLEDYDPHPAMAIPVSV